MKNSIPSLKSLPQYIDYLQSGGNYILLRKNALSALRISSSGFNMAICRLAQKGRVIKARQGFYIIVPLEYKNAGGIPASWFIDSFMQFHKQPYYVGLLSAAALYGAAHQQPQEFQVITNKVLRPIVIGRTQIRFFLKKEIDVTLLTKIKTTTGYMCVSNPELTAVDLLRYINAVGQMNNAAMVIMELAEKIDSKRLLAAATKAELPIAQRLGYLLDTFVNTEITQSLYKWFSKKRAIFSSLIPGQPRKNAIKNQKWKLWINEKIEVDES